MHVIFNLQSYVDSVVASNRRAIRRLTEKRHQKKKEALMLTAKRYAPQHIAGGRESDSLIKEE
jgi:hypothetical protein